MVGITIQVNITRNLRLFAQFSDVYCDTRGAYFVYY